MVAHKKLNLKEKITDDYLDLSLCNLEKIPIKEISDISKLQHIKEIDLSKNHLQSLPDNIGSLVNLKSLDLLGNELKTLPASFGELKALQWLDLKDNPLDLDLKKYAGECNDEAQCKKCAINVVRFMKQIAAEEERKRQIEIRRKKEDQAKKEAQELAKEKEMKLQKKREREQKKLEQKLTNKENIQEIPKNVDKNKSSFSSNNSDKRFKSGFQKILSAISFLFFLTMIFLGVYLILINYCEDQNKLRNLIENYSRNEHFSNLIRKLDQKVCPIVNQNKIPYENLTKLFQQINF